MNMGQLRYSLIFLVIILLGGCAGKPAVQEPVEPEPVVEPVAPEQDAPPVEQAESDPVFSPDTVSQEVFDTIKVDVQQFIEELNRIIRSKNYNAWKAHLADGYFAQISSAAYLTAISDTAAMKAQKRVLKSAMDYFNFVVVPSRANSRVDDIEFISENIVKAFTLNSRNERLRLYELERTGDTWKIIN